MPQVSELVDDEIIPAAGTPSPDVVLIDQEDQQRFARALARLSEVDRTAVVARLQLGYSYEQIALLLDKRSANAARMTVTRAIARLIEAMAEEAT
jgi:RNA polymerase sigma-70 factor (ECF subfamily)